MSDTSLGKVKAYIGGGAVLFLLLVLLLMSTGSFFTVGPGQAGVVFDRSDGVLNQTYDEGLHFKVPYWQDAAVFTTRVQKYSKATSAASNDLQEVETTVALNYHISRDEVHDIYKNVGPDYKSRILDPAIKETVKAVTASHDAQALIQNRSVVKDGIKTMLTERLERNHLSVDEVSIENFQFTKEFAQAIEQKEIARQKALEEKNRLEAVKHRADQRRAEARGEADAIRIISEQLSQSPGYIEYLTIKRWNGQTQTIRPLVEGGGSAGTLLELPSDFEHQGNASTSELPSGNVTLSP